MPRGKPPPKKQSKSYQANAPEESDPYDDLDATKAYAKEQSKSKAVKFGGFGNLNLGLGLDAVDALDIWSSDDDFDKKSVDLEPPAIVAGRRAARRLGGEAMGGLGPSLSLGAAASLTADFRSQPLESAELPRGLELVGGGDPRFEKQEDGTVALAMPEQGYLKATVPRVPRNRALAQARLPPLSARRAVRLHAGAMHAVEPRGGRPAPLVHGDVRDPHRRGPRGRRG